MSECSNCGRAEAMRHRCEQCGRMVCYDCRTEPGYYCDHGNPPVWKRVRLTKSLLKKVKLRNLRHCGRE